MTWIPLRQISGATSNPIFKATGLPQDDEAWANDTYEVLVRYMPVDVDGQEVDLGREGVVQLSIKRYDREPIRDWRHLQQIKNEVMGPEREAVEIFPRESRLVDTSNQYHLWVGPEGMDFPMGFPEGKVATDDQAKEFNRARTQGLHKGKQRPWEAGLTTGRTEQTPYVTDEEFEVLMQQIQRHANG